MFRLFSQNNQGSNGLSGNVKKLSKITYEANRFLSNHWQAGGGGRKTRGPSVFFRRRRLATELGFATCRWVACGKAKLSGKSSLLFERKVNLGLVHNLNLNMKA